MLIYLPYLCFDVLCEVSADIARPCAKGLQFWSFKWMTFRACDEALAHGFIGFMGDLYLGCSERLFFEPLVFLLYISHVLSRPFGMVEPSNL